MAQDTHNLAADLAALSALSAASYALFWQPPPQPTVRHPYFPHRHVRCRRCYRSDGLYYYVASTSAQTTTSTTTLYCTSNITTRHTHAAPEAAGSTTWPRPYFRCHNCAYALLEEKGQTCAAGTGAGAQQVDEQLQLVPPDFVCWADGIGVRRSNRRCHCGDFPSAREDEAMRVWRCATGSCAYSQAVDEKGFVRST